MISVDKASNENLQMKKIIDCCNSLSNATDIEFMLINENSDILFTTDKYTEKCMFCKKLCSLVSSEHLCPKTYQYGGFQAKRFGGRYIFFCHLGLVHFCSPILKNDVLVGSIISQPIILVDKEEYFQQDVLLKYTLTPPEIAELQDLLKYTDSVSTEKTHAVSEQLFINAIYISEQKEFLLEKVHENQRVHSIISSYIESLKKGKETYKSYPFEKENDLMAAISIGAESEAKMLLNELLGQVFFHSAFNFNVIKMRVIELISLLSRATVKGGADIEQVLGLNCSLLGEIEHLSNIEDLSYWLSNVMHKFVEQVFQFSEAKHADIIHKAISYMRQNYMEKLALEEVSQFIGLSPPYFSKIFKEETKMNYNSYLNQIRVEASKRLLKQNVGISDISNMVGYEDQSYFTKVFKRLTGVSPGKFRQSQIQ